MVKKTNEECLAQETKKKEHFFFNWNTSQGVNRNLNIISSMIMFIVGFIFGFIFSNRSCEHKIKNLNNKHV